MGLTSGTVLETDTGNSKREKKVSGMNSFEISCYPQMYERNKY